MALSFSDFIRVQLFATIPQPTTPFTSKTVIVTGANSGLGKEAVKKIVALGASKVILGCRNIAKGKEVKLSIESTTKCSPDLLEVWPIDLASHTSVQEFAARAAKLPRLDVLLCNAGVQSLQFSTAEKTETTMTINVVNTVLLGLLLIPKLRETANTYKSTPHLTFVGSHLYSVAKFPEHQNDIFAWLGEERNFQKMGQYNLSKLFLLFAIRKLASLVDPLESDKTPAANAIVINSLDPCFCKTGLGQAGMGLGMRIAGKIFSGMFARTSEEGARCVVIAASAGRESHGGYFRVGAPKEYAPMIYTPEGVDNAMYLWEQLGRRLEKLQPGVLGNVTAQV